MKGVTYILCALVAACGHTPRPVKPTRVAVVPLDSLGLLKARASRMSQDIARQVASLVDTKVVEASAVRSAVKKIPECQRMAQGSRLPCGAKAGRALGASHVVVGAVGGLGKTYVLQLELVHVDKSAVTRAVEETLFGDPGALRTSLARITSRLFDIPPPRPWYTRWWIWTLVGAAAAAAITVPLVLGDDDPYEDYPLP